MSASSDRTLTMGALLSDMRVLLVLFISFRFILFISYQPFMIDGAERGIGVGGDRAYHYALTAYADEGLLPFRDWWSEFPPVWYLVTTGVYLGLGENASYDNWSLVLGLLMILAETVNLVLMRRIGERLHGRNTGIALAWVYALLIVPVVFMWWNFDSLVTLFLLAGLDALIRGREARSALAVAMGALVKFVPFLLFGAVIRFLKPQRAARYIAMAVGVFVLAYLPLFALNSELTLVSLTAQFNKPSYQTVWALLDGNYTTGNFGTLESHLVAEGVTEGTADKNPAIIPGVVRLALAGAIGLFVFWRTRRFDSIGMVAFTGITLLIFYLQSQGWSPQWLTQIIPLILLVFPTRNGVYISAILSLLAFSEYPFIFIRTGDTGGEILPGHPMFTPWVLIVVLRTLILAAVCVAYYQKLRQEPVPEPG